MNWAFKIAFQILFILCLNLILGSQAFGQNPTLGLLYQDTSAFEGYTLFSPERNTQVFLINNCGEKVNSWTFTERPGATCYLLNNGNLLRAGKDSLEIRDWNNQLIWSYAMNLNGYQQHHDIEPLPNGNILAILTDSYTRAEAIAMGRDSNRLGNNFKMDRIVELQPVGSHEANLIWDWTYADHLIQDFDSTKANYGAIAQHPELVDINYDNGQDFDFTHCNGMDYNASLDQIILSSRHLSEVHIIDHSTSTIEAAGHQGGNSNKGGDLLWRWGNPQVYQAGSSADQMLIGQHDSKWVETGYLDAGKVSVFNNDGDNSNNFSSVHLINPVIANGQYQMQNGKFLPTQYDWSYSGDLLGEAFYESKKSGGHALPNGHFIICETSKGNITEVNKSGQVMWRYKNPSGDSLYNQFDQVLPVSNSIFRAEKYPPTHPAFANLNLSFSGTLEDQNALSDSCLQVGVNELALAPKITFTNPASQGRIEFHSPLKAEQILIFSSSGQEISHLRNFNGRQIPFKQKPGLYFISIRSGKNIQKAKLILL